MLCYVMSKRPNTFKITFGKFEIFYCLGIPRIARFSADYFRLEEHVCCEVERGLNYCSPQDLKVLKEDELN